MKCQRPDREITGAGGNVKDPAGCEGPQRPDRFFPPVEVNPSAQQVIQQIVTVRDGVKKGADPGVVHILQNITFRHDTQQ
jgi:hypothetical protein